MLEVQPEQHSVVVFGILFAILSNHGKILKNVHLLVIYFVVCFEDSSGVSNPLFTRLVRLGLVETNRPNLEVVVVESVEVESSVIVVVA